MTLTTPDSLRAAVCWSPFDRVAHQMLVDCLQESGDGEGALQAARRWVVACPEDDDARWAMARLLNENCKVANCPQCLFVEASGYAQNEFRSHATGKCDVCGAKVGTVGTVSDGRRELGEFVGVQLELAGADELCVDGRCKCDTCCRRRDLHKRERKLWMDGGVGNGFCKQMPDGFSSLASPARFSVTFSGGCEAFIERGFPSRVRISLDAWCGVECGRCDGDGWYSFDDGSGRIEPCDICSIRGTPLREPLGVRLCREWPLMSVEFTDVHPTPGSGDVWYYEEEFTDAVGAEDLAFHDEQECRKWFQAAALAWARERAMREVFGVTLETDVAAPAAAD